MRSFWTVSGFLSGLYSALILTACCMAEEEALPIQDLRMPLGHYTNGVIKIQLAADEAQVPESGPIVARGVLVEFFDPLGKVESTMTAKDCTYDRAGSTAHSESDVRVEEGKVLITGTGFRWEMSKEKVWILNNVRVTFGQGFMRTFKEKNSE